MKYFILCLVLLLFGIQTTFSQKLNFGVCNEISELELRDNCLKSSLDNLFVKKLLQLSTEMSRVSNSKVNITFDVEVSRVGLFTLRNFESSDPSIYNSFNELLIDIVPLSSYKQNNRLVKSTLKFEYLMRFVENSQVEIYQLDKLIFSSNPIVEKKDSVESQLPAEKDELEDKPKSETEVDMPFAVIENVPVFPGCEPLETNKERKDCMSDNISTFLVSNFNLDLAKQLDLPDGRVRISVQFKISSNGYVTDIMARAPHPELEKEAKRVINSLPKFIPGKQRGENVNVLYSLPIIFQVESDDSKKK